MSPGKRFPAFQKQQTPLKRLKTSTRLDGATTQKTVIVKLTYVSKPPGSTKERKFIDKHSDYKLISIGADARNNTDLICGAVWSYTLVYPEDQHLHLRLRSVSASGGSKQTNLKTRELMFIGLSWTTVVDLSSILFDLVGSKARGNGRLASGAQFCLYVWEYQW